MLKQKTDSMRSGYTLVEILMATALALILLTSAIRIFMMMNEGFAESRILIELLGRVRSAQRLMERDLSHYMTDMCPPRPTEAEDGYFCVGCDENNTYSLSNEKLYHDGDGKSLPMVDTDLIGECFDYFSMTVFNKEAPFRFTRGETETTVYETPYAEVVWLVYQNDLYRIVVPFLPADEKPCYYGTTGNQVTDAAAVSMENLTSLPLVRYINPGVLGKKENRIQAFCLSETKLAQMKTSGRLAAFLVLPNVLFFEVQLWNPATKTYQTLDEVRETPDGYFAFHENVDLGSAVYDTWSAITMRDETHSGTLTPVHNAMVTSNNALFSSTDSANEPPSRSFLPGMRVLVRAFDPDSGQVREFRVAQTFRRR